MAKIEKCEICGKIRILTAFHGKDLCLECQFIKAADKAAYRIEATRWDGYLCATVGGRSEAEAIATFLADFPGSDITSVDYLG